jgi:putative transposase
MAGGRWQHGESPKRGIQVGPNPTDRAKNGVKRSVLVEGHGLPLAAIIAGANVPDAQMLDATIRAVVLERPPVEPGWEQHLLLDKGYDNDTGYGVCVDHEYVPHIALIRDERPRKQRTPTYKPRRWVVERALSWLNGCRAILIRWDRRDDLYLALIKLASILLWYRHLDRISFLR